MIQIVSCSVLGFLFIVIPYTAEFIAKKRHKKVPYLFDIPKPVRYITISFIIFSIIFASGAKKEEEKYGAFYIIEEEQVDGETASMDEPVTELETTIQEDSTSGIEDS